MQRGPASVGPSRFTHCPTCQMRNQCCESCRPSRWTNSRPRRQKSVILEKLGRRGSILSTYSFFYTSLYVICTISARRCTSHRRLWLAVRDLQGEQTRNRRSRRRCDFAVPDRTPASGCAEESSQLVYKSFNRHRYYWLVSAMISIRSIPYECPTFACQIFFSIPLNSIRSHVALLYHQSQPLSRDFPLTLCALIMIHLTFSTLSNVSLLRIRIDLY